MTARKEITFCLSSLFLILGLGGCAKTPPPTPVTYEDGAPHPLPPVPRERAFDGSLYAPGGLGDLASDHVALSPGDPVIIRFGLKNGYPGIPQGRVTRLMAQVVRVDSSGSFLVSAQRTVRDSSGVRRVVLVGRVAHESLETGNEVPISMVSMLRFRSESPSDHKKAPNFKPPGVPGKAAVPPVGPGGQQRKGQGRTP